MLVRDIASLVIRLPDGSRPHSTSPLALDIAIINNLENNYWDETRQAGGTAYFQYARRERQHNRTEAFYLAAGVQYLPLVWEAQGGLHCRDPSVLAQAHWNGGSCGRAQP